MATTIFTDRYISPLLEVRNRRFQTKMQAQEKITINALSILTAVIKLREVQIPDDVTDTLRTALTEERDRWHSQVDEATRHLTDHAQEFVFTFPGPIGVLGMRYCGTARMVWISDRTDETKLRHLQRVQRHFRLGRRVLSAKIKGVEVRSGPGWLHQQARGLGRSAVRRAVGCPFEYGLGPHVVGRSGVTGWTCWWRPENLIRVGWRASLKLWRLHGAGGTRVYMATVIDPPRRFHFATRPRLSGPRRPARGAVSVSVQFQLQEVEREPGRCGRGRRPGAATP
ncbi:hypothetical protein AB0D97_35190 [Streptomyces roseus]|uniref:hypothetical protein n=1 Tax=Streptomyces roseus TaxID=66430 RepID=UPI00340D6DEF